MTLGATWAEMLSIPGDPTISDTSRIWVSAANAVGVDALSL